MITADRDFLTVAKATDESHSLGSRNNDAFRDDVIVKLMRHAVCRNLDIRFPLERNEFLEVVLSCYLKDITEIFLLI